MFLAVVGLAVIVATIGGATAVSFSSGTVARDASVPVADDTNAVVDLAIVNEVQSGNNNQEFGTVTNRFDSTATFTVEIIGQNAKENVDFSSTGTDTLTVSLDPGESVTLFVDVDRGAHTDVNTVDFVVSGGTDDGNITVRLDERVGPEVVNPGGGGNGGNDNPGNGNGNNDNP
ncbi:MAG: hypothetical protein V5A17_08060, partial [Natronomonas sp.]